MSPLIITCFVSENKITQTEYINVNEDLSIGYGQNYKYKHYSDVIIENDIPDDYNGELYTEDFWDESLMTIDSDINIHTTCEGLSSHGPGRELGYNSSFLTNGCNCYRRTGYSCGSNSLPYYINTKNFTDAEIIEIERQVDLWNQAIMHDGTGQIVNLYRVYNTSNIAGRPVLQVHRVDKDNEAGSFLDHQHLQKLKYIIIQIRIHLYMNLVII